MKKNTSKTKGSTRSSNLKKAKLEDWKRRSTKAVSKKQDRSFIENAYLSVKKSHRENYLQEEAFVESRTCDKSG